MSVEKTPKTDFTSIKLLSNLLSDLLFLLGGFNCSKLDEKSKTPNPVFLNTEIFLEFFLWFESRLKIFNMIYQSSQSDDYLRYTTLRGKQKKQ